MERAWTEFTWTTTPRPSSTRGSRKRWTRTSAGVRQPQFPARFRHRGPPLHAPGHGPALQRHRRQRPGRHHHHQLRLRGQQPRAQGRLFRPDPQRAQKRDHDHPGGTSLRAQLPAPSWRAWAPKSPTMPVNADGIVDVETLRRYIDPDRTALVSVMWANNETGLIFPVARTGRGLP